MPREVDSNQFRRGEMSIEELKSFAEQAAAIHTELLSIVDSLKNKRLTSIRVDGIKKIPQAIEIFRHGIRNVKKGIVDAET